MSIESGYDSTRVLEVLINTLIQKNIITENEADQIKQAGRGATYRQSQSGYGQTGQGQEKT